MQHLDVCLQQHWEAGRRFPFDCIISDLSAVGLLGSPCEAVGTSAVEVRISGRLDRRAEKKIISLACRVCCVISYLMHNEHG